MRRAFTLVELMIASGLFLLVAGGAVGTFVGIQRMTKTALAESELAIDMRLLREKLLFHAAPPHDGRTWSGLLSGACGGDVIEGGAKILMDEAYGFDTVRRVPVDQRIELVATESAAGGVTRRTFVNDGDRYDDQWPVPWLGPGGFSWLPESGALDDARLSEGHVFYVNLAASADGVARGERIVVPVFGEVQRTLTGGVFDD